LIEQVRACFASLFTDRAILYRLQQGFSHQAVALSVVVQQMVRSRASGILFTADPVSGHRGIASIDAGFGLGEALVSGLVEADLYRVDKRDGRILEVRIGDKALAIEAEPGGGTRRRALSDEERRARVLSDAQIRSLVELGSRIEAHYGSPQDIEWCLAEDRLFVVQARPITSLFPVPEPRPSAGGFSVYLSFGHAQVMPMAMPPMAISIWRIFFPFGRPEGPSAVNPYMISAGGRLFVDVTALMRLGITRRRLPEVFTAADRQMAEALREVVSREDFLSRAGRSDRVRLSALLRLMGPVLARVPRWLLLERPEGATEVMWARFAAHLEEERREVAQAAPGAPQLQVARAVLSRLVDGVILTIPPLLISGLLSLRILKAMGGDAKDLEALGRGLSGNVTTDMDLAVGDLADAVRRAPGILSRLREGARLSALSGAEGLEGAEAFLKAWGDFLRRYGMRGPREIDISRPRYRDDPSPILMAVVGNLEHEEAGAHRAKHRRLQEEGEAAAERLVAGASRGLLGGLKGALARRMVRVARSYLPLREHPKLVLIHVLDLVRAAVLSAADLLVSEGRLSAREDVWFLGLDELLSALSQPELELQSMVAERKADFVHFERLTPPRLITSDGEIVKAPARRGGAPEGALVGVGVSGGVAEGLARVVLDPAREVLGAGEILVAPFTDPGWTPLFINARGLVMEVGGLLTHGSVVAREYGIPAVVSVDGATRRIETGQRIRVDGDRGFVEILGELPSPISLASAAAPRDK
jgi:phosphohistidine swiveling domain-containing protein